MTAPPGGGVTYHIRHSPVLAIDMITCVGEASTSEAVDTSILLTGLDPKVFYSVMIDAIIQDVPPMVTGPGKIVYMCILFSYAFIMQILGTIEVTVRKIARKGRHSVCVKTSNIIILYFRNGIVNLL